MLPDWQGSHGTAVKTSEVAPPNKNCCLSKHRPTILTNKTHQLFTLQQWKSKFSLPGRRPWEILEELRCELAAEKQTPIRDFS